jgi:hypothetical protein
MDSTDALHGSNWRIDIPYSRAWPVIHFIQVSGCSRLKKPPSHEGVDVVDGSVSRRQSAADQLHLPALFTHSSQLHGPERHDQFPCSVLEE